MPVSTVWLSKLRARKRKRASRRLRQRQPAFLHHPGPGQLLCLGRLELYGARRERARGTVCCFVFVRPATLPIWICHEVGWRYMSIVSSSSHEDRYRRRICVLDSRWAARMIWRNTCATTVGAVIPRCGSERLAFQVNSWKAPEDVSCTCGILGQVGVIPRSEWHRALA